MPAGYPLDKQKFGRLSCLRSAAVFIEFIAIPPAITSLPIHSTVIEKRLREARYSSGRLPSPRVERSITRAPGRRERRLRLCSARWLWHLAKTGFSGSKIPRYQPGLLAHFGRLSTAIYYPHLGWMWSRLCREIKNGSNPNID